MKKIKKNIGKLLVLLCACLTVGSVVNAAGKASTSVDITIEADASEQNKRQGTDSPEQKEGKVQTGDSAKILKYAVALGTAVVTVLCRDCPRIGTIDAGNRDCAVTVDCRMHERWRFESF